MAEEHKQRKRVEQSRREGQQREAVEVGAVAGRNKASSLPDLHSTPVVPIAVALEISSSSDGIDAELGSSFDAGVVQVESAAGGWISRQDSDDVNQRSRSVSTASVASPSHTASSSISGSSVIGNEKESKKEGSHNGTGSTVSSLSLSHSGASTSHRDSSTGIMSTARDSYDSGSNKTHLFSSTTNSTYTLPPRPPYDPSK